MGILEVHQKNNIRYSNKDLTFFEPTKEQLNEIKEIIQNSILLSDNLDTNKELDIRSTRYIIRELTNIGAEIDEYSDNELLKKLNNGDRILRLLLKEVQKFIDEQIDDIFEEKIKQTKAINTLINIINSKQDLKSLEIKINKFFKKNKINMKYNDFINISNSPEIIQELTNKLNIKTK
jgi:hypothetical protein